MIVIIDKFRKGCQILHDRYFFIPLRVVSGFFSTEIRRGGVLKCRAIPEKR